MSNVRIGLVNWADSGTVTVTGMATASSAPASNLKSPLRGKVWAGDGSTYSATFSVDFGSDKTISSLALFGIPIIRDSAGAPRAFIVKFDLKDAGGASLGSAQVAYSSAEYQAPTSVSLSGAIFPAGVGAYPVQADGASRTLVAFCAPTICRTAAITVSYAAPVVLRASRLWAGQYWEPAINMNSGGGFLPSPPARLVRTQGGSIRKVILPAFKKVEFTLARLSAMEVEDLNYRWTAGWMANEVLLVLYPETTRLAQVMMATLSDITHLGEDLYGRHSATFTFEGS